MSTDAVPDLTLTPARARLVGLMFRAAYTPSTSEARGDALDLLIAEMAHDTDAFNWAERLAKEAAPC